MPATWRKWLFRRELLFLLIGTIVGYLVAILVFREEVRVDSGSGRVEVTYSIWPVSRVTNSDRAFELVVPSPADSGRTKFVTCRRLFPALDYEGINLGYILVRAEYTLLPALLRKDLSRAERKEHGNRFFAALAKDGEMGAMEYAQQVYNASPDAAHPADVPPSR